MKDIDKYVEEKVNDLSRYMRLKDEGLEINWESFIHSIIRDCRPKVSREFIEKWEAYVANGYGGGITETEFLKHRQKRIKTILKEAGVEVEK